MLTWVPTALCISIIHFTAVRKPWATMLQNLHLLSTLTIKYSTGLLETPKEELLLFFLFSF